MKVRRATNDGDFAFACKEPLWQAAQPPSPAEQRCRKSRIMLATILIAMQRVCTHTRIVEEGYGCITNCHGQSYQQQAT